MTGYLGGVGLVLAAALCWSTGGILVRQIEAADAWQVVAWRSIAVVLCMGLVVAVRHRGRTLRAFRAVGAGGVLAGACLAAAFTGYILSVTHTTVANTLFVMASAPVYSALLARFVLGEAVRPATWIAIAAAPVGIAVMVGEGLAGGGLYGTAAALLAALGFAGYTVTLRGLRAVDMTPSVVIAGLIAAAVGLAAAGTPAIGWHDLAICFALGAVQITLASVCFIRGARTVPAAELSLLALLEVVLAPLWVWLALDETPSGLTLAGGGIVLAAVLAQALARVRG